MASFNYDNGMQFDPSRDSQNQSFAENDQHAVYSPTSRSPYVQRPDKGFFGSLFDLEFNSFIALKFAKIIYGLSIGIAGFLVFLAGVVPALAALFNGSLGGAISILLTRGVVACLVSLFLLILVRLFLEFAVATIKTSENTSKIAAQMR